MNIYTKLSILCVSLVVFTSSVFYFFVNNVLEKTIGRSAAGSNDVMLDDIQSQLIIVILVILAVALLLSLIAAHLFVRPIVRLTKMAEAVSKGDFETQIVINSNDELGKLASLLSRAAQNLIKQLSEQREIYKELHNQKSKIESQTVLLEQANKQVSDSLMYAQRIQRSILPEPSTISKVVSDLFVFFSPKDVVSGDFYWFERVRQGRNEYLIIVCADCTGHGVPGAIMSIMGSNQLTNIIYYQNYVDPTKILARLDKVIKFELKGDDNLNRDGMDMGLCVINLDNLKMEFAGAGIPLWLVKKDSDELQIFKSPKQMIGGVEGDEKEVSEKLMKAEIQLEEGDKIYMASDGFQDQFGGSSDKKFMRKKLRETLLENSKLPMSEQNELLKSVFNEWKGDSPQTDDVLVCGIEI